MLKLENHIQFTAVQVGIFFRFLHGYACRLTNRNQIKFGQYLLIHFLQVFMDTRTIAHIGAVISVQTIMYNTVRVCGVFGNHTDNIHAEAIHPFLAPPGHHVKNFLAHLLIFPVQIRLFFGETVQIIHLCFLIVFPGRTAEASSPVVGFFTVFRVFPDIVIPVRIVL